MKLFSVSFLLIALLIELSGAVQATDYAAGPLGNCSHYTECEVLNVGSQPVSVKITIYDLSTGAAASSFCEPNGNYTSNCSETDDDDYVTCTIPAGKAAFLDCFDCAVQYCQVTASEPTVRATFAAFLGGDTPSAILQLQQQ